MSIAPAGRGFRRTAVLVLGATLVLVSPAHAAADRATSATVQVSPLAVALTLATSTASTGQHVQVSAAVHHLGPLTIRSIGVELRLDERALAVRGGTLRSISQLRPGRSSSVTWRVCAREPGSYLLLARVMFEGHSIESDARLLTVAASGRQVCG